MVFFKIIHRIGIDGMPPVGLIGLKSVTPERFDVRL